MASIKITKQMADDAAELIVKRLYDKKIKKASEKLVEYVDKLANKYIPQPIIAVTKEFGRYYISNKNIIVRNDCKSRYMPTSFTLPNGTCIDITKEEWDKVLELKSEIINLKARKNKDWTQWSYRLKGLGTLKKMQELLPEAVDYVNWPDVKELPSVNYRNERSILQLAKKFAEDED